MLNNKDKKNLLIYSFFSLLFIYPLIQAGVYYRDDLDRAITGQYGWKSLGRPVADLMMRIFSASGRENLDLFPYTMLFSCFFIALSALLIKKHLDFAKVRYASFSAGLIIFNPFMLQNVAYRFDSAGMALAMMLAVASYTFNSHQLKPAIQRTVKIIAGILSLSIYQPCANIFIGLIAIDLAILCTNQDKSFREKIVYLLNKAADFFIYYILYILFIAKIWKHSNTRATTVTFDSSGLDNIINTSRQLYTMVSSFFHGPVVFYFAIPLFLSILITLFRIIKNKKDPLLNICLMVSSFVLLTISLLGPNIFLQEAPVFPRTLVSFSTFFVILSILLSTGSLKLNYFALIPVIPVFAFSAQLSNALKEQRDHEDMIFNFISQDLLDIKNLKAITITGEMNISPSVSILVRNKPLISYFLSPAAGFTADYQLINKGFLQTTNGYDKKQEDRLEKAINLTHTINPVKKNTQYSLYLSNNEAIVKLGNDNAH